MFPLVSEVPCALSALEVGDPHTSEHLMPLVYDELPNLAAYKLVRNKPRQTVCPRPPTVAPLDEAWSGQLLLQLRASGRHTIRPRVSQSVLHTFGTSCFVDGSFA